MNPVNKFMRKVQLTSDCWLWRGSRTHNGYGQAFVTGIRSRRAHRISWELLVGQVPESKLVLHKCDNPLCVRPSHLFLGTQQDNIDDMFKKGRANKAKGIGHGMAKLTPDKVIDIRRSTLTHGNIAAIYRISRTSVTLIKQGKRWAHLTK